MASNKSGSAGKSGIKLSPMPRVTNKGMDHALSKGGPHKSAGVNKSIRMGAGMGPSGKLGKQ